MSESNDREPPSEPHRILLFLDLVHEYHDLADALPVPSGFTIGGKPRDPADHWHRLLRAFAVRKFVSDQDRVCLVRVAKAVGAQLPAGHPGLVQPGTVRASIKELQAGHIAFGDGSGEYVHADEITEDLLYGVYLHGDYGKWKRTTGRARMPLEFALSRWLDASEHLVFEFEDGVRGLVESGEIVLPEPPLGPHEG